MSSDPTDVQTREFGDSFWEHLTKGLTSGQITLERYCGGLIAPGATLFVASHAAGWPAEFEAIVSALTIGTSIATICVTDSAQKVEATGDDAQKAKATEFLESLRSGALKVAAIGAGLGGLAAVASQGSDLLVVPTYLVFAGGHLWAMTRNSAHSALDTSGSVPDTPPAGGRDSIV